MSWRACCTVVLTVSGWGGGLCGGIEVVAIDVYFGIDFWGIVHERSRSIGWRLGVVSIHKTLLHENTQRASKLLPVNCICSMTQVRRFSASRQLRHSILTVTWTFVRKASDSIFHYT